MAERPPDEPEDQWSEVIKQVHAALDDAQIDGESIRSSLLQGVRRALSSLEDVIQPDGDGAVVSSPSVVVMEGGRTEDEPASASEPPELRIADEGDDSGALGVEEGDPDSDPPPVSATVRVIRTGLGAPTGTGALRMAAKGARSPDTISGRVFLEAGSSDAGQTLFRGTEARCYRVHCEAGQMRVLLDGQPVELLLPGQSMDVETCLLRVLSVDGKALHGHFRRIGDKG